MTKRWVGGVLALLVLTIGGLWMWNPMDPLWRVMEDSNDQNPTDILDLPSDVTDQLLPFRPLTDIQLFAYGWRRAKAADVWPAEKLESGPSQLYVKEWPRLGFFGSIELGCVTTAFVEVEFEDGWQLASADIREATVYSLCY